MHSFRRHGRHARVACALLRFQSTDQSHLYLTNVHVEQPDGLDNIHQTKAAQQHWLNVEQWDGYSDTYLNRFMQYAPTIDNVGSHFQFKHPDLDRCLKSVFDLYGPCAAKLEKLNDDPLHARFHSWLAEVRRDREKIAVELDKVYPSLHPTVKIVYDAYLVRRYYHLEEWAKYVEKKRAEILERMTPEYMEHMKKAKGLADSFIFHLEKLETAIAHEPTLGMLQDSHNYTDLEMAVIRQRASYFRKTRKYGKHMDFAESIPT